MEPEFARPINHSGASAVASTAAGAAGEGVKSGLITGAMWIGGLTLLGLTCGAALGMGGFGALGSWIIGSGAATGAVGTAALAATPGPIMGLLGSVATPLLTLAGGMLGFSAGTASAPLVAGTAGVIGAVQGGSDAADRVNNERAAAQAMQAQVEMVTAQTACPKITPEEYALLQSRMRGGEGYCRTNHAESVVASQQAAAQQPNVTV